MKSGNPKAQVVKSGGWLEQKLEGLLLFVYGVRVTDMQSVCSIVTLICNVSVNCYLRWFENGCNSSVSGSGEGEECASSCCVPVSNGFLFAP